MTTTEVNTPEVEDTEEEQTSDVNLVKLPEVPQSFLDSDDDLVSAVREDFIDSLEKFNKYAAMALDFNHRDARVQQLLETSDTAEAEAYRDSVEKMEAAVLKMKAEVEKRRKAAETAIGAGLESSPFNQEQVSAFVTKYRKAVLDYVDPDAFPSVVEALGGKSFSLPTIKQLIHGKKSDGSSAAPGSYKLRVQFIEVDGTRYEQISQASKALGVDNQHFSEIIVNAVGDRKIPDREISFQTPPINGKQHSVKVRGLPPKATNGE